MYKRLIGMEDDYWAKRALMAEKSGYLLEWGVGPQQHIKIIDKTLKFSVR